MNIIRPGDPEYTGGMPTRIPKDNLRQSEVPIEQVRRIELMYCKANDSWGAAIQGGRFVCPLPKGYGKDSGITIFDGRLIITHPGKPSLWADPMTGKVWVRG